VDASEQKKKDAVTKTTRGEHAEKSISELFAQLVRDNKRAVYAIALSKLRNMHDAEDVMQDVFIEVYRSFDTIRNPQNVRAWLYKTTLNRCNDHFRKLSRREKRERIFAEKYQNNPSTEGPGARGRNDVVRRAIELLPEDYRHVLMLKHFAMFSYAEISEMTGLSQSTITGRLQTARKMFRERLIELGEEVD
jgi:RNA polymerase sigma-70 factor (ECF subfamily)